MSSYLQRSTIHTETEKDIPATVTQDQQLRERINFAIAQIISACAPLEQELKISQAFAYDQKAFLVSQANHLQDLFFEKKQIAFPAVDNRNLFGLEQIDVHYKIGNCLFEAIAAFVPHATGDDMRALATTQIRQDAQLRAQINILATGIGNSLLTSDGERGYASADKYIELMNQDQTWGTQIELIALARALQRPIVIFTPNNTYDDIIAEPGYAQNAPIFLNYINTNHYAPVVTPPGQNDRAIYDQVNASILIRKQEASNPRKFSP